ncbi:MAG: dihydroorotase, partial [Pseudomonadales bacterium]|nr:dihydroorotase [Pseudomonadales bacterium]
MNSILIKQARLLDPSQGLDKIADVFIRDGIIVEIMSAEGNNTTDHNTADIIIDGSNQILCPGFIDLKMHLGEPGREQKGTIASETRAAAASGFTQLVCSPNTL